MNNPRSSGKPAGSTGRGRAARNASIDDNDAEPPFEAERREFHAEQPPFNAEGSDTVDQTTFKAEVADMSESMPAQPAMPEPPQAPVSLREDVKEAAKTATRAVKQQAAELVGDIGHELSKTAEGQKVRGTEAMRGFARAITTAADELEGQSPLVARYVRDAAKQVEGLSGSIGSRSVNELIHAASDLARSRPAIFFGGAVAAGIVLSRFLKSSAKHRAYAYGGRQPVEGQQDYPGDRAYQNRAPGAGMSMNS